MALPNFTVIADSAIDPNSPITTELEAAFRDNDEHLEQWLGKDYVAEENHNHDGVNSAYTSALAFGGDASSGSFTQPAGTGLYVGGIYNFLHLTLNGNMEFQGPAWIRVQGDLTINGANNLYSRGYNGGIWAGSGVAAPGGGVLNLRYTDAAYGRNLHNAPFWVSGGGPTGAPAILAGRNPGGGGGAGMMGDGGAGGTDGFGTAGGTSGYSTMNHMFAPMTTQFFNLQSAKHPAWSMGGGGGGGAGSSATVGEVSGSGGDSGSAILVTVKGHIYGTGFISAPGFGGAAGGGAGGAGGGGGGGGAVMVLCQQTISNALTIQANGGPGGAGFFGGAFGGGGGGGGGGGFVFVVAPAGFAGTLQALGGVGGAGAGIGANGANGNNGNGRQISADPINYFL